MSVGEVAWRFGQKRLSSHERKIFSDRVPVYEVKAFGYAPNADFSRLGINLANVEYSIGGDIDLLGDYSYEDYKKRWHAGFQTDVDWPFRFSADYSFGGDDVPGDIRTNWELSRHHQFSVLAKSFYVAGDCTFLDELEDLFIDWNEKNPFMWGPEWASPMEESIRLINWLVAAAFLESAKCDDAEDLTEKLRDGAWAMAGHVRRHYSRYSSANNHTIVEAAGVAVASVVFGQREWLAEALSLLEAEVGLQTHGDGVNKEQALHYQLFVMEALCLVSHVLAAAGEGLSEELRLLLRSMARYVRACCVGRGQYVEFGDDDEGVILNLGAHKPNYPEYVLSMASLELGDGDRWVEEIDCCETINWLYPNDRIEAARRLSLVANERVESFPEGGVTIVRFDEGRAVLAFDHGPLGFGQLAAHGHSDALSVQLYVDGEPVLIDPGTFVYNGNREMRDYYRSTGAHNTVCLDGKNQSEATGPFLWGRKAMVTGFELEDAEGHVLLAAEHDGYAPVRVRRTVHVRANEFDITDEFVGGGAATARLHLPVADLETRGGAMELHLTSGDVVRIEAGMPIEAETFAYSPAYGVLAEGMELRTPFRGELVTTVSILRSER